MLSAILVLTPTPQPLDIGMLLCFVLLVLILSVVLVAIVPPRDEAPPAEPPRARTLVPAPDARRLEAELRDDIANARARFLDRRPSPDAVRDN